MGGDGMGMGRMGRDGMGWVGWDGMRMRMGDEKQIVEKNQNVT